MTAIDPKTLPCVIAYDDIEFGDLIETAWREGGLHCRREGVAATEREHGWFTSRGGVVAWAPHSAGPGDAVIRLLERPTIASPPPAGGCRCRGVVRVITLASVGPSPRDLVDAAAIARRLGKVVSGWDLSRLAPEDAALISTGRQDLRDLALSLTDAADALSQQLAADAIKGGRA